MFLFLPPQFLDFLMIVGEGHKESRFFYLKKIKNLNDAQWCISQIYLLKTLLGEPKWFEWECSFHEEN